MLDAAHAPTTSPVHTSLRCLALPVSLMVRTAYIDACGARLYAHVKMSGAMRAMRARCNPGVAGGRQEEEEAEEEE